MKNKKIYTINENNFITKEGEKGFSQLYSTTYDATLFGVICLIFIIINAVFIKIDITFLLLIIYLIFLISFTVINMYLGTKKYYRYALHKYVDCILVDGDKYVLLTNLNKLNADSAKISSMSLGANMLSTDNLLSTALGLGFYANGLDINDSSSLETKYDYDEFMDNLKNNNIKGYVAIFYENVKFEKENKYTYYFRGDLIKKNGRVVKNKKFKIQKIYHNYESLKEIK